MPGASIAGLDTKSRQFFYFFLVMLPLVLFSLFRFSIGLMLPVLQDLYSMSNATAGILSSASVAGTGIGVGLAGTLSEKYSEKMVCFFGMILFSIPLALSINIPSFWIFSTLLVLSGLGSGLMTTPIYTLAGNLFPRRRGTAIGVLSSGYNIGGFIGPSMTGFLLTSVSVRLPFETIGAIGIVFALIFLFGLPKKWQIRRVQQEEKLAVDSLATKKKKGFADLPWNRNIVTIGICMLLSDFAFLAYATWTVKFLENKFAELTNGRTIGFFFGISIGLGAIGIIIAGILLDRIGGKKTAFITGTVATISTILLYHVSNFVEAIGILLVVGFFSNWFWGLLSGMAQTNAPPYRRTNVTGLVQAIAFIGAVFGPGVTGLIGGPSLVSESALLLTVSAPFLLFSILIMVFYRDPTKDTVRELSSSRNESL